MQFKNIHEKPLVKQIHLKVKYLKNPNLVTKRKFIYSSIWVQDSSFEILSIIDDKKTAAQVKKQEREAPKRERER